MGKTLFETSWEVANKVGGIHTVLSTKAKTLVEEYGDDYITLGPWLLSQGEENLPFEDEQGFDDFIESCRELGVPIRVGRWQIPGRPRTILVEFSGLFEQQDGILSGLWEKQGVDSLYGGWEYIEPVLFGHACGMVIEQYWKRYLAPIRRTACAQFHEWMTGSGLLYLSEHVPSIGTVFTTHATILGRSLSSGGLSPEEGLGGRNPDELARELGIRSKHSLEGTCARQADVFTTVSEITAREAELLHERAPDPLLPNGMDLEVIDAIAGEIGREEARARLLDVASRFFAEDLHSAALVAISGRYEFHNKGIDVFMESLAQQNETEGRTILGLVLVPAGNSGPRPELLDRLGQPFESLEGALGISTHSLIDPDNDAVSLAAKRLGIFGRHEGRVRLLQIPVYLDGRDAALPLNYEALARGLDLTLFPSFYEPWGYTPEESLALGVPTVTSDFAGFGRFCLEQGLDHDAGVDVLRRVGKEQESVVAALTSCVEERLREISQGVDLHDRCRETSRRTDWADLIANYRLAFRKAMEAASQRGGSHLEKLDSLVHKERMVSERPVTIRHEPRLEPFEVSASIPEALGGLSRLASNYWWCWDPEAQTLFEEISPRRWKACRHNPIQFLKEVYPDDLEDAADDAGFVARLDRIVERMDRDLARPAAETGDGERSDEHPVAYFCAEFGIHESLRIYSGGLGLLAGDHLKAASDLALPLLGVGLFYTRGYMSQRLTVRGEQVAVDQCNDPRKLPMEEVRDREGKPLRVSINLPGSRVLLRAWKVAVGRVPLYLLDPDLPENRPEDREICAHLYGGGPEMRLRQEILLGKGGVRLLDALGIEPSVWHMNEGHAAFLAIDRVARLLHKRGLTFDEARAHVKATTLFTTHTPVPAGHDRFDESLMRRYFSQVEHSLGLPWERFFALGQAEGDRSDFNMSYLALQFSSFCNGVSALHGEVSKTLFQPFWPGLLEKEIPVSAITNGVHLATWIAPKLSGLLGAPDRSIRRVDYAENACDLSDEALWPLRQDGKQRMLAHVEARIQDAFIERNDSPALLTRMLEGLDGKALYIGFARRFAPYKRAHLLFRDPDLLARLLDDPERPMRILFAGKAHPRDQHGQDILRRVVELSREDRFVGKILFLEDYDIALARELVRGVDVWLNTPTRPLEASGTSGMKVALNGGLNLSILDGWWCEGYDGNNGWAIGEEDRIFDNQELQDEMDSSTLYRLLEEELLPLYFQRDQAGLPHAWLQRVRHSLQTIPPQFSTERMVGDYDAQAYRPLSQVGSAMHSDLRAACRELVGREKRLRNGFGQIRILETRISDLDHMEVGEEIQVTVRLDPGPLDPEDLVVEFVLRRPNGDPVSHAPLCIELASPAESLEFSGTHRIERSGGFAYGIRVRARSLGPYDLSTRDLVLWA